LTNKLKLKFIICFWYKRFHNESFNVSSKTILDYLQTRQQLHKAVFPSTYEHRDLRKLHVLVTESFTRLDLMDSNLFF